jgi:hypothetical protein
MANINLKDIAKGIDLIVKGSQHPLAKTVLRSVLPDLGLTPAQLAELDATHADYQARKARAQKRAGR